MQKQKLAVKYLSIVVEKYVPVVIKIIAASGFDGGYMDWPERNYTVVESL